MRAVKAKFDGRQIILPDEVKDESPGEVIVVFPEAPQDSAAAAWLSAQEEVLRKVWDNPQDAEYDRL